MRIVFAGTPEFAAQALDALLQSRHSVVAVLSQPDRPAGRGQKRLPSAVKQRALQAGLPVLQPLGLRVCPPAADESAEQAQLREMCNQQALQTRQALLVLQPDVMVVAAYGLLLPRDVLDLPRLGCLNIHASLLPRWRGAAPIVRAIEAGDAETGVCIMRMEAGLDTGPIGLEYRTPISTQDTAGRLHDRLARLGAQAIVEALDRLQAGELDFVQQVAGGVTYAAKIDKRETRIDWSQPAEQVSRQLRAFDPPGAGTQLAGREAEGFLRLFEPRVLAESGELPVPGTVHAVGPAGIDVVCGRGLVRVQAMQRPGGRRQPVDTFLRGYALRVGDRFVSA
ncbi:MAG: methionyl-tRNA formyltransferase [Lautropia sp.]|nr:methionyl-tRNA formyltransferase [Lautropia sp.]